MAKPKRRQRRGAAAPLANANSITFPESIPTLTMFKALKEAHDHEDPAFADRYGHFLSHLAEALGIKPRAV